jgi:hypothetical protein
MAILEKFHPGQKPQKPSSKEFAETNFNGDARGASNGPAGDYAPPGETVNEPPADDGAADSLGAKVESNTNPIKLCHMPKW